MDVEVRFGDAVVVVKEVEMIHSLNELFAVRLSLKNIIQTRINQLVTHKFSLNEEHPTILQRLQLSPTSSTSVWYTGTTGVYYEQVNLKAGRRLRLHKIFYVLYVVSKQSYTLVYMDNLTEENMEETIHKNCFVVGQKLEGIDPKHPALFCIMTVLEVYGYRIKLHCDGYPDDYDFWVCADCPDLFYPGWCELNSRILQPPKDYGKKFDWIVYLRECQALPAPKHNFVSTNDINSIKNEHKFHIGGKLEALDKVTRVLAKQLICVATVVDILGNRVCIHLDGWTDDLDYWVHISSTNIHPVRWCDNNGKTLTPPKGYKDGNETKTFNWTEYLKETNSEPVPEDAFVRGPFFL